jgi:hypothetical protein
MPAETRDALHLAPRPSDDERPYGLEHLRLVAEELQAKYGPPRPGPKLKLVDAPPVIQALAAGLEEVESDG